MFAATQRVFLDFSNAYVPQEIVDIANSFFGSAIEKVQYAFAETNVEIILTRPESGDYSTLHIGNMNSEETYLGIAEFDQTFNPNDNGIIGVDNIIDMIIQEQLTIERASNLIANIIAHEIGHLAGLEHSNDPVDVMHDGLTQNMIENPPQFYIEQYQIINTNAVIANSDNLESYSCENYSNDFSYSDDKLINEYDNDSTDDCCDDVNIYG